MKLPKIKNKKREVKIVEQGRRPTFSYRDARNKQDRSTRINSEIRITADQKNRFNAGAANIVTKLVIISLIFFVGYLLWIDSSPKVQLVNDNGTIKRDVTVYENGIHSIWAKGLLNKSKLTINSRGLIAEIKETYPEVKSVVVDTPLIGSKATVLIELEKPKLILVTPEGGFYLSSSGKAMAKLGQIHGNTIDGIPTVLDESGLVPKVGELALSGGEINSVIDVIDLLSAAKLSLTSVKLPNEPNQMQIVVQGTKYSVKLSLDQSAEQGVGALLALRDKFAQEGIVPAEYVDLRVPDKAFYK